MSPGIWYYVTGWPVTDIAKELQEILVQQQCHITENLGPQLHLCENSMKQTIH